MEDIKLEYDDIETERNFEEEEVNSADGLTEEEYQQKVEDRKKKQIFLKTEIISNGYKPEEFTDYIANLKEDGNIFFDKKFR